MKQILIKVWRVARWPLAVLVALYIVVVLWRVYAIGQEEATAAAVEAIHASRLTMADVTGENLPPAPDAQANDATLAGVDANNNGIRDDVELAIFAKYPKEQSASRRNRAALLQYAKAMQMEFTKVTNSPTFVAVIQEESRGSVCIGKWDQIEATDNLILNTTERQNFQKDSSEKYMTSYPLPNSDFCDIDPASLN